MPDALGAVPHHCGNMRVEELDIGLCHRPIKPHERQYVSLLKSSLFMLHWPQEGQRGSLFLVAEILGGLFLFALGTDQPFFGRLTLGMFPRYGF